jgi:hypothetical protein
MASRRDDVSRDSPLDLQSLTSPYIAVRVEEVKRTSILNRHTPVPWVTAAGTRFSYQSPQV